MIEVRCFTSLDEVAFLRDEINALNRTGTRPDPFSSFEFFEHFMRYEKYFPQSHGLSLWFLTAFTAGRLIGYMALKQVSHRVLGLHASKIDFLVTHDADRPQLVARPENALAVSTAFYTYLLQRKSEWSFLEFRQQNMGSPLFPPPTAVKLKGCWIGQWPSLDNGTIYMSWITLAEYFNSFSQKFRSNVSRQMRTLLAAGEVEYLTSADPAITPALFEQYCTIEPRSWKSRAGNAIGRHPQWVDYLKGLLDPQQPMQVSIHMILFDGVPIAGLITGAFERGIYALHMVYDNSFSRLAPGSAMLLMGMRQAIDGKYDFLNLLSGFGYYKTRWQAKMTETYNAQIYRIGSPFFWRRVLGNVQRRVSRNAAPLGNKLFNPTRRDVAANDTESTEDLEMKPQCTAEEHAQIAALKELVRRGEGEFLSAEQLASVMPFKTQRPKYRSELIPPGQQQRVLI